MKNQLLAFLATEQLAIDPNWLQSLIDAITFCDDIHSMDPETLKALIINAGEKVDSPNRVTVRGNVGITYLSGPIFPEHNLITRWLGIGTVLPDYLASVKQLVDSPDIKTIINYVSSPGGSVVGINEGANMLAQLGKQKPIISYVSGANASAAYWLTTAAGKIFADATSAIGSIGVIHTSYKKGADSPVIEIVNSKSPNKNMDVETKDGKKEMVKVLDAVADVFIASVAKHRKVSVETVESDFGKGGILIGQDAVDAGMIDGLTSFEELVTKHSTDAAITPLFTNQTKGESTMDLAELKAKYPEIYQAACAEGAAEAQATIATKNAQIKGLEDTIVTLEAQTETTTQENATMSERLVALERANALQAQKEIERNLKAQADAIFGTVLATSSLHERTHAKIKAVVDFNRFVDADSKLDEAAYTAALQAEIKDFESVFAASPVSGVNGAGNTTAGDSETEDEALARMLGHIGVK